MAAITSAGMQVYEYKLVVTPHEDLADKIRKYQKYFSEKYKADHFQQSTPQLLLARFKQIRAVEDRLISRLNASAQAMQPIKIEINNFGSYPAHTIYMNVTSKGPVTKLVNKIKEHQRLMKLDADNKPHFLNDAHLTIASKLKPWQYEQGWLEFSHLDFTARFIADTMTLLKRRQGELKYNVAATFDFKNIPEQTSQGILF